MKVWYRLKGKDIESNIQPSQDNREDMVKKLEKGSNVTCSKCHKEGHKSNKCSQPRKKLPDEKNKKKLTIKVLTSTSSPTGGTNAIAPHM